MTNTRFQNLQKSDLLQDPFQEFEKWFLNAKENIELYPEAMALSTIDSEGYPSTRYVLLRGFLPPYFQFFTNYNSHKGQELLNNPKASLLFYWKELGQQIRIWGDAEKSSEIESDNYWFTRPESRIHSIASHQSETIKDYTALLSAVENVQKEFEGKKVTRPENWGGFNLKATKFEFWHEGEFRLHHRFVYTPKPDGSWDIQRLNP